MKKLSIDTYILTVAQALNLTTAVISVTISAVAGSLLVEDKSLSTLPYGLQFAAVMFFTFPVSLLMKKIGRKRVFYIGSTLLFFSGIVGYFAMEKSNFYLLSASHFILGSYISIANYYRFAAADSLDEEYKAGALSLVVAGGVLAAFFGPLIANYLKSAHGFADFSLCYASMALIAFLTFILIYFWNRDVVFFAKTSYYANETPTVYVYVFIAIVTSSWGYLSMNLLMIQASLVMQGICTFDKASSAIQAHVIAMFLPSFFASHLIKKIGHARFVLSGYALLCMTCSLNFLYFDYLSIYWSLIILGIGWNFMYVGGSAFLTKYIRNSNQHRWQGINDSAISLCATVGAFLPAPLFTLVGWEYTNVIFLGFTLLIGIVFSLILLKQENKWATPV